MHSSSYNLTENVYIMGFLHFLHKFWMNVKVVIWGWGWGWHLNVGSTSLFTCHLKLQLSGEPTYRLMILQEF